MRVLNVGGSPLSNLIEQIEAAAKRQGFVLINGDELVDPAQFFPASNDNAEDCGCPPGFCADDEGLQAEFDLSEEHLMNSIFGNVFGQAGEVSYGHGEMMMTADEAEAADLDEKRSAVAQLGRIIENLTIIAGIQADLVAELVDS